MNTKLMTMSLAALLALSPLGTAGAITKTEQAHQDLNISHDQTMSTGQSLAATARSLREQKKALILQLNQLIPAGANTAWDALFTSYNQVALDTLLGDYNLKSSGQNKYLGQLKDLAPSVVSGTALQDQVARILGQLQTLKVQEDAWARELAKYQGSLQAENKQEQSNNTKRGK